MCNMLELSGLVTCLGWTCQYSALGMGKDMDCHGDQYSDWHYTKCDHSTSLKS